MRYHRRSALVALALCACTGRTEQGLENTGGTPAAERPPDYMAVPAFEALSDGGRIVLQGNTHDPRDVASIRSRLQEVMSLMRRGDFTAREFGYGQEPAGARVMSRRRDFIQYSYADLPNGGEIRITTIDPEALSAIHAFIAFQQNRGGG